MSTTTVLSYLRVSSRGQVDGDGFTRQREKIDQWIQIHGAIHLGEFREEGVSGTTDLLARPALSRLMERILSGGGIQIVLIEKADRLARDLIVGELLLRQFAEMGVQVIECEGGNDLTIGDGNPTATLVRQILGAVAEFEKSSIVRKLRSARNRKRAETGRCEGVKPYGVLAGEEQTVTVIRGLRSEGLTTRQIAEELNTRGIKSRTGGVWRHSVVARVLANRNTQLA
jgi:DNA invertase Pin-like site-specific DNA recombinase